MATHNLYNQLLFTFERLSCYCSDKYRLRSCIRGNRISLAAPRVNWTGACDRLLGPEQTRRGFQPYSHQPPNKTGVEKQGIEKLRAHNACTACAVWQEGPRRRAAAGTSRHPRVPRRFPPRLTWAIYLSIYLSISLSLSLSLTIYIYIYIYILFVVFSPGGPLLRLRESGQGVLELAAELRRRVPLALEVVLYIYIYIYVYIYIYIYIYTHK